MGLGWLRLILSLLVIDSHYEVFRTYLQPWLVDRFGVQRLAFVGEGGIAISGFFVISGYVIAYVLCRKYDAASWRGIGSFYVGRALRIYPLYVLVFAAYYATRLALGESVSMTGRQLVDNILLMPYAIYGLVLDRNQFGPLQLSAELLIPPAWTLGIDLLLYLVAPFLVVRKAVLWPTWIVGCAFFVSFIVTSDPRPPVWFMYLYSDPVAYIFAFACGALVFHYRDRLVPGMTGLVLAGAVLLWLTFFPLGATNTALNQFVAIGALTFMVAALCRFGGRRFDRFFGDLTYATYLLHLPMLLVVQHLGIGGAAVWALVLTYALATILLYGMEYPLDRLRDNVHRRLSKQAATPTGATRSVAVALWALFAVAAIAAFARNALYGGSIVDLTATRCPDRWTCSGMPRALTLTVRDAGHTIIAPAMGTQGRVVIDVTVNGQSSTASAELVVEQTPPFRAAIVRKGARCELEVEHDGQRESTPRGWNGDCARMHRFVFDGSAGKTVLAVDSLWVFASNRPPGLARLSVSADAAADGVIALNDVFVSRTGTPAATGARDARRMPEP
ncbi:MAG TPA: acyltransferase [Casimicrobiaceae bacterium]|nr:acyltransferase [Casimicrobiaceae bacterium]